MNLKAPRRPTGGNPSAHAPLAPVGSMPAFAEPGVVAPCLAPMAAPFEVDVATDALRYSYAGRRERQAFDPQDDSDGEVEYGRDEALAGDAVSALLDQAPEALVERCRGMARGRSPAGVDEALEAHAGRVGAGRDAGGDPIVEGWLWDASEDGGGGPGPSSFAARGRRVPLLPADRAMFTPAPGCVLEAGVEPGRGLVVDASGVAWMRGVGDVLDASHPVFAGAARDLAERGFILEAAGEVVEPAPVLRDGRRWWRMPHTRDFRDEDGGEREERVWLQAAALVAPVLGGGDPDGLGGVQSNVWHRGGKDLWSYSGAGRGAAPVKAFVSCALGTRPSPAGSRPGTSYEMVEGSWDREWSRSVFHDAVWLGDVLPDAALRSPEVSALLGWSWGTGWPGGVAAAGLPGSDPGFAARLAALPVLWTYPAPRSHDAADVARVASAREADEEAVGARRLERRLARRGWRTVHVPADYPASPLVFGDGDGCDGVAALGFAVAGAPSALPRKSFEDDPPLDLGGGRVNLGLDLMRDAAADAWPARIALLEGIEAAMAGGDPASVLVSGIGAVAV